MKKHERIARAVADKILAMPSEQQPAATFWAICFMPLKTSRVLQDILTKELPKISVLAAGVIDTKASNRLKVKNHFELEK